MAVLSFVPSPKSHTFKVMVPDEAFVNAMGTPAQTGVLEKVKAADGQPLAVLVLEIKGIVSVLGGEAFTKPLIDISSRKRISDFCFIKYV